MPKRLQSIASAKGVSMLNSSGPLPCPSGLFLTFSVLVSKDNKSEKIDNVSSCSAETK